jgi:hypothetical protein
MAGRRSAHAAASLASAQEGDGSEHAVFESFDAREPIKVTGDAVVASDRPPAQIESHCATDRQRHAAVDYLREKTRILRGAFGPCVRLPLRRAINRLAIPVVINQIIPGSGTVLTALCMVGTGMLMPGQVGHPAGD